MSGRYPFPAIPNGWFRRAHSSEAAPGVGGRVQGGALRGPFHARVGGGAGRFGLYRKWMHQFFGEGVG